MSTIYDQLHQFETREQAEAAFGTGRHPEDGNRQQAAWLHEGVSVVPVQIILHDPDGDTVDEDDNPVRGRRPADGYWLGLAVMDAEKAGELQALPSARIAYVRPEAPTPWRDAVTWSAMPLDQMPVLECGAFAGSGYVFD